jgi:hypothetical protein
VKPHTPNYSSIDSAYGLSEKKQTPFMSAEDRRIKFLARRHEIERQEQQDALNAHHREIEI